MKKELVGVDNLEACICRETGSVYIDGSIILTPGAKDELSKRGIAVVYGPRPGGAPRAATQACPPGCTCKACCGKGMDVERLILGVACILKEEYGIHDPAELHRISCQVVKIIQNNV